VKRRTRDGERVVGLIDGISQKIGKGGPSTKHLTWIKRLKQITE
jgi:hypothetical protein